MTPTDWRRSRQVGLAWIVLVALADPVAAQEPPTARSPDRGGQSLRERLTERADELRVLDPFRISVFGRPLSLQLQLESVFDSHRPVFESREADAATRIRFEQEIAGEAFYELSEDVTGFAQLRIGFDQDLLRETPNQVSDLFVERGEMWLRFARDACGAEWSFEVGRLSYEDDRLWWWDDELDSLRATVESGPFEIALAVARELGPLRSDRSEIEPDDRGVLRVLLEASWDWRDDQTLQFFALYHDDHSPAQREGDVVRRGREDDSDARLVWLGLRSAGGLHTRAGVFGHWFDLAAVVGREQVHVFEDESAHLSRVGERFSREVAGWGIDVGGTWIAHAPHEPRVTLGLAVGSGDPNDGSGSSDHAFRQTRLHANSPGFGGVRRFVGYGILLEPELSNLWVTTADVGVALTEFSSLDLVHHYYRLLEPSTSLREAAIESDFSAAGRSRDVGHGLDLVLGIAESASLEIEVSASAFRAGKAWGEQAGQWAFGGFLAIQLAF